MFFGDDKYINNLIMFFKIGIIAIKKYFLFMDNLYLLEKICYYKNIN